MKTYDVCIVGSGAGGGMAAYALTQAGADVVMLEAGDVWYASEAQQDDVPQLGVSPSRWLDEIQAVWRIRWMRGRLGNRR
jgi:choline dehydrogenase-like flavoprotein